LTEPWRTEIVSALRGACTSRKGLRISKGARGIVAEDRGSTLVVFFDEEDAAVNLTELDLCLARR
jgi:hypothetical protein